MATQITIKRNNPISEAQCSEALSYMATHLTDEELSKLYTLAKNENARAALHSKWELINSFLF